MPETHELLTMDGAKLQDWYLQIRGTLQTTLVVMRDAIVAAARESDAAARNAALRDAARRAWDAAMEYYSMPAAVAARERYLDREHPLPARECVHDLKTHPIPFAAVLDGRKTFEWRKDDRGYAEGDTLLLREWEPSTETYTGREVRCTVSYVLRDGFNVPDGYAVLGFKSFAEGVGR